MSACLVCFFINNKIFDWLVDWLIDWLIDSSHCLWCRRWGNVGKWNMPCLCRGDKSKRLMYETTWLTAKSDDWIILIICRYFREVMSINCAIQILLLNWTELNFSNTEDIEDNEIKWHYFLRHPAQFLQSSYAAFFRVSWTTSSHFSSRCCRYLHLIAANLRAFDYWKIDNSNILTFHGSAKYFATIHLWERVQRIKRKINTLFVSQKASFAFSLSSFTARRYASAIHASAILAVVMSPPSVCLSVCHTTILY